MFRAPNIAEMLRCKCALDAVFRLQIDTWKNYRSVKAMVDHIAPLDASDCPCCDQATTSFLHELSDSYCDTCPSASFGAQEEPSNAFVESNREQWEMLAKREPQALRSELASALIGTATLHEAQAKTLELLDAGESVFSVSGNGTGQSLIFHRPSRSNWRSSSTNRASSSIRCVRSFPIRRSICVRWFRTSA